MQLAELAERYETVRFLDGDPSWFMHQVRGDANREAMAFVASCLSFGSRAQFMPKIQWLLERSGGDVEGWIARARFEECLPPDSHRCFYRFLTCSSMNALLRAYRRIIAAHGSLGSFVRTEADGTGYGAVSAICRLFATAGCGAAVPKDARSACKRVCMFLRWMVRSSSPVDLGLWADFIDRRTLIVPLDTHVARQARRLGLLPGGGGASMGVAKRLTAALAEAFPDDPLRGDFALFGYGIAHGRRGAEPIRARGTAPSRHG